MDAIAKLITAIAQLLWPLLGFYFLWLFKQQIANILKRLNRATKVKAAGIDIELDKLEEGAEKAVQEIVIPALPSPRQPVTRLGQISAAPAAPEEPAESPILREAAQSPKAALLLVGSEIQRRLRQLLAATNWQQNIKPEPLSEAIDKLRAQGSLPEHVTGSLKLFLDVRNKLIHGEANDDEIFRAIDSGLTLLRTINSIPAEVNVVHQAGVTMYSDPGCTQRIADATGLILENNFTRRSSNILSDISNYSNAFSKRKTGRLGVEHGPAMGARMVSRSDDKRSKASMGWIIGICRPSSR